MSILDKTELLKIKSLYTDKILIHLESISVLNLDAPTKSVSKYLNKINNNNKTKRKIQHSSETFYHIHLWVTDSPSRHDDW